MVRGARNDPFGPCPARRHDRPGRLAQLCEGHAKRALAWGSFFAARNGKKSRRALPAGRLALVLHDRTLVFDVVELGVCYVAPSHESLVGEPTRDRRTLHAFRRIWRQIRGTET